MFTVSLRNALKAGQCSLPWKKEKTYKTQHYFIHGYEEELNITVNNNNFSIISNNFIEFCMSEYPGL